MDFRNEDGLTPLMDACLEGDFDICELLLNHGADVHLSLVGQPGKTALHAAACLGDRDIFELLVKHGAEIFDFSLEGTKAFASSPIAGALHFDGPLIYSYFMDHYKTFPLCVLFIYASESRE